jgi:hypothetical protein
MHTLSNKYNVKSVFKIDMDHFYTCDDAAVILLDKVKVEAPIEYFSNISNICKDSTSMASSE